MTLFKNTLQLHKVKRELSHIHLWLSLLLHIYRLK